MGGQLSGPWLGDTEGGAVAATQEQALKRYQETCSGETRTGPESVSGEDSGPFARARLLGPVCWEQGNA